MWVGHKNLLPLGQMNGEMILGQFVTGTRSELKEAELDESVSPAASCRR